MHHWRGASLLFTGLPASGKSTTAQETYLILQRRSRLALVLDGDELRSGLSVDLGFSADDRSEHARRCGEVALLLTKSDFVVLIALICPLQSYRARMRAIHQQAGIPFAEIYLNTPLDECMSRDPKGLYASARSGALDGLTGIAGPYEPPRNADLVLAPEMGSPAQLAAQVISHLDVLMARSDGTPMYQPVGRTQRSVTALLARNLTGLRHRPQERP